MAKRAAKTIRFFYVNQDFHFPARNKLKKFLLRLFSSEGLKIEAVNYIFCSDKYLLHLNKEHLNHKSFTDIITFQYSSHPAPVFAEIYISIDRVRENARLYNVRFLNELYRVVFHGALHLCGYKDKTPAEISQMRSKEDFYLESYVPRETR